MFLSRHRRATARLTLALGLLLACGLGARAQLVADGTTNTLNGITTNAAGNVDIGTSADNTLLIVTNNTKVTNAITYIGHNAGSEFNRLIITGTNTIWLSTSDTYVGFEGANNSLLVQNGAILTNVSGILGGNSAGATNNTAVIDGGQWNNSRDFYVGLSGGGNLLIITNGGRVWTRSVGTALGSYVGFFASAGSNNVVVSGAGSLWTNLFELYYGYAGASNSLLINDGGRVENEATWNGLFTTASNNLIQVTGSGSLLSNRLSFTLGSNSLGNRMVISNGAHAVNTTAVIGGTANGYSNSVLVTGAGSLWSNKNPLFVGKAGRANTLVVSNGAVVTSIGATIGDLVGSGSNRVTVTGTNSMWRNTNNLVLGNNGVSNSLTVSDGGTVYAGNNLFVGNGASSANNSLTVSGGNLRVTNALGSGILRLLRGWFYFQGGTTAADFLELSSTSGGITFGEGELTTGGTTVANGAPMVVGNGSGAAVFNLNGTGTHSFADGLIVRQGSRAVVGNGNLSSPLGVTIEDGAALELRNNVAITGVPLTVEGTGLANDGALRNISGTNSWNAAVLFTNTLRINSDAGRLTLAGGLTGVPGSALHVGGAGNIVINGVIDNGTAGLVKDGAGTVELTGATGNLYTGDTDINAGTLRLNVTSGVAIAGGTVTIQTGGTLLYGNSNQIAAGVALVLDGGTFNLNGFNQSAALGALTLNIDSAIDYGLGGNQILRFGALASAAGTTTLRIYNWQGIHFVGGGNDQLIFNNTNNISQGFLDFVWFDGYGQGAMLLVSGEIVPIPEPATTAGVLALAGCVMWRERRRFAALIQRFR